MIDPKELRIGNLTDKGIVFGISHQDGVQMIHILNNKFASTSELYFIKDINPIELTEEWLLKFGFEKNVWKDINYPTSGIDYFHKLTDIRISLNDDVCKKGVHWFQNWYFFETGKELTIK